MNEQSFLKFAAKVSFGGRYDVEMISFIVYFFYSCSILGMRNGTYPGEKCPIVVVFFLLLLFSAAGKTVHLESFLYYNF